LGSLIPRITPEPRKDFQFINYIARNIALSVLGDASASASAKCLLAEKTLMHFWMLFDGFKFLLGRCQKERKQKKRHFSQKHFANA
jgi:hypothetical protein